MHRIDTSTAQKDKFGAGKSGFTSGNPQTGVPATEVSDEILDSIQEELCAVIEAAGVTLDKTKNNQLLVAIQTSIYPIGAPIPWPLATPPTGFLLMTGQAFNPATYPKLALAYPSGTLRDLRGEFIRGWDNGRGVDTGRAILSDQAQGIQSHNHSWLHRYFSSDGPLVDSDVVESRGPAYGGTDMGGPSLTTGNSGGTETRPRNIAYSYIVRAA